jgi:hypothetical protein
LNLRLLLVPNLDRQLATVEVLVRNDRYRAEKQTGNVRFVPLVVRTMLSLIVGYDDIPAVISLSLRVPRCSRGQGMARTLLQFLPSSRSRSR